MEIDIIITPEIIDNSRIYSITSIQVPNIVTQGKTIDEAKKRLKEALELYFEEMPEEKNSIIKISKTDNNAPMISRMLV